MILQVHSVRERVADACNSRGAGRAKERTSITPLGLELSVSFRSLRGAFPEADHAQGM